MLSIRYRADTLQLFHLSFMFSVFRKGHIALVAALSPVSFFLFCFSFFYCYGLFVKFSNFSFLCFLKKRGDVASGQQLYLAHAYWNKVCSFASAILSVCSVFSENTSGSMSLIGFLLLALQAGFWSGLHSQQLQHFRFSGYPAPRATSLADKMTLCRSLPILRPILCQTLSSISFSLSVSMTRTDTTFSFFLAAFSPKQTLNIHGEYYKQGYKQREDNSHVLCRSTHSVSRHKFTGKLIDI